MSKSPFTYLGIVISYFSITGINLTFKYFYGDQLEDAQMLARETLIFAMVGLLLWIVFKKENRSLESIGLHNRTGKRRSVGDYSMLLSVLHLLVVRCCWHNS
jgi:cytosine/uracil/thiamine/allantoin permease